MKAAWLGVFLLACSKDETKAAPDAGAAKVASCDRVVTMSTCSEYRVAPAEEKATTAACAKLGGTFVEAECPNTSVIGSCRMSTGEVRKLYAGGGAPYDLARGQKDCTGLFKGTWTAQ